MAFPVPHTTATSRYDSTPYRRCDRSGRRKGLEYVGIFYSRRVDAETPLEETMGRLATLDRQGKELYLGISSNSPALTTQAPEILKSYCVSLLIHEPSYSMLNRWIEEQPTLPYEYPPLP
jgi:L-glyceraldehyde 3-phosphate reductase